MTVGVALNWAFSGKCSKRTPKKAGFIEAFQGGYKNGEFIQTSNLMQIYGNLINDP